MIAIWLASAVAAFLLAAFVIILVEACRSKIRRLEVEEMRAVSEVLATGSETAIAGHLATVLNNPEIAQLKHDKLARLVDELICLTFVGGAEPDAQ